MTELIRIKTTYLYKYTSPWQWFTREVLTRKLRLSRGFECHMSPYQTHPPLLTHPYFKPLVNLFISSTLIIIGNSDPTRLCESNYEHLHSVGFYLYGWRDKLTTSVSSPSIYVLWMNIQRNINYLSSFVAEFIFLCQRIYVLVFVTYLRGRPRKQEFKYGVVQLDLISDCSKYVIRILILYVENMFIHFVAA